MEKYAKVKQLREQKNMTQEELAEKSGISVRTIQRIESGTIPKGFTLRALAKALEVEENELVEISNASPNELINENVSFATEIDADINYTKIKFINLSSILFIAIPPFNILVPYILSHFLKEYNMLTKQIISLQILWTIISPLFFLAGILLKLGPKFTIVLLALIVLTNVFLILCNAIAIDKDKELRYKLNFSLI